MLFHLPLGFREKSQIPSVAERSGDRPDRKGAEIPDGIEQAGAASKLAHPLRAPGQVVLFFPCRALERLTRMRIFGRQRLTLIERLRAHLAHVVNAHERGGMPAVVLAQLSLRQRVCRRGATRLCDVTYGPKRPV